MARRVGAPLSPRGRGRVTLGSCPRQAQGQAPRPGEGVAPSPDGAAPPHPNPLPDGERGLVGAGLVLVGEFGRAHGLRGEVRLKSFTDDPAVIARYGPLTMSDGGQLRIAAVRPAGGGAPDMLIARVEGVSSREAAEALNRVQLFAHRESFAEPEEDEFFLADLVGLAVEDLEGNRLGTVAAVPNYGGGDLLEISPAEGGATALLPFTKAFVPKIELLARRITIDPPVDFFGPPTEPPEPDAP